VTHILRPGKASEKTPKGVIPPSLCEISQNASRKKKAVHILGRYGQLLVNGRSRISALYWFSRNIADDAKNYTINPAAIHLQVNFAKFVFWLKLILCLFLLKNKHPQMDRGGGVKRISFLRKLTFFHRRL
jgi:hypothetical protein